MSKKEIRTVEDLNVGDLATFMELTMPMELLKEFQWSDYPNLENLYRVCSKVQGFSEIHQPFLEFCQMYRTHRDAGLPLISPSTRHSQLSVSFSLFILPAYFHRMRPP